MSHIEQEIAEQPDVLARLLEHERENVAHIAAAVREYDPAVVLLVARGSSDNAARYAQYLFGVRANMLAALATPSVHTLYGSAPRMNRALVIGISQSGASDDIRRVMQDAAAQDALTVAITNNPNSPLAEAAAHHIDLHAGEERSVAATKTYTSELMAVAMLVDAITGGDGTADLAAVAGFAADTLQTATSTIPNWVQRYRYMPTYAVIGRGYNYATAFEISLKIKELCYISGGQYSEADFRHGPMALVEPGYPVVLAMPGGKTYARQRDLLRTLHERGAETLVISDQTDAAAPATQFMALPPDIPEWTSPILAVLPGQVFAWHLAAARGLSLDEPRGLNKVTITE